MTARNRGRTAWIGPVCFGLPALAFCLYTRIDPGHAALFTALGACVGYLFTLFPLLTFTGREPLDAGRPATGNETFRAMAFALLARRIHRHSPAAVSLDYAVGTAARDAGGAALVGPATAVVHHELAAGHDVTARQATAAAREVTAWFSKGAGTPSAPRDGGIQSLPVPGAAHGPGPRTPTKGTP